MHDAYLEFLELGIYELQFAFEGLADENVWKRPAPQLLSVGENAGHLAYGLAVRLSDQCAVKEPDLAKLATTSPLIDPRFWYYSRTLPTLPTEAQLAMTATDVHRELLRVYEAVITQFKAWNPDFDAPPPGSTEPFPYREYVKYQGFHLAYHTGQMYSVRHLLGETTPDN